MAKAIETTITRVQGDTLKVGKLADRTFRTVKPGDYLPVSLTVKGKECRFYAEVLSHKGNEAVITFGSHGKTQAVVIPAKVNVYRPL